MNARIEIKTLLLREGMTITQLAAAMSKKLGKPVSRTSLSNKLGRNSIDFNEIVAICEILNYKIIFEKQS